MAKNQKDRRIEPSFESSRGRSRGLSARDDDRAVQPRRKVKGKRVSGRGGRGRRSSFGLFGRLLYWCFVLAVWCGIGGVGLVAYYGAKMPSVTSWNIPDRPPNVKIVSADGQLLANRGMTGGEALSLKEMSPFIPKAVVAIEDRRFYSHFGVDPLGLGRAMATNLVHGHMIQGGSTLTQQLAKNLFLKPDRTLERKVQEVLMALWLEHKYSKDQILELYLNRVYFGSGSYGVEAASRRYFGKSAKDVTLSEAATLAGLLKAPSKLSPARDPKAAQARAGLVLDAMQDQGLITAAQEANAAKQPAARAASFWTGSENYVADKIMEELPDLIGETETDITVQATVDLRLQKVAENDIRALIDKNRTKANVSQGALVSIDGAGAVRAMVGGYDYATSQFDRASEARRQPGSAFKPFVYLAAIENGLTPNTVRNDAPVRIGNWSPDNYNGKYYGPVTLTTALAKSLNSVAAQLVSEVGPAAVVESAWRLGIQSSLADNSSIALGTSEVTPLELTAAYVPFANGGFRPDVHFVEKITNDKGKVIYKHENGKRTRVISAEADAMMNTMMTQTIAGGTASKAAFNWPAAGKTGTSQKSRDAWFVGYTANLTTGVWFGNDDGAPTKNVTGGGLPVLAWHNFMVAAHDGLAAKPLPGGRWQPVAPPPMEVTPAEQIDDGDAIGAAINSSDIKPAAPAAIRTAPSGDTQFPPRPAVPVSSNAPRPAAPLPRSRSMQQDTVSTGSVVRPKADVGRQTQRGADHGKKSVLDVLLGR